MTIQDKHRAFLRRKAKRELHAFLKENNISIVATHVKLETALTKTRKYYKYPWDVWDVVINGTIWDVMRNGSIERRVYQERGQFTPALVRKNPRFDLVRFLVERTNYLLYAEGDGHIPPLSETAIEYRDMYVKTLGGWDNVRTIDRLLQVFDIEINWS